MSEEAGLQSAATGGSTVLATGRDARLHGRPEACRHEEEGSRVGAPGLQEERQLDGAVLDEIAGLLKRYVILPKWAAETLALWVIHTYSYQLRDVTAYIGVESPEKRCGKTTLLSVMAELVCDPEIAANISPPAFFRVIAEKQPTLIIDEADTLLRGNDPLRGILNAGHNRKTGFVLRVVHERPPSLSSTIRALLSQPVKTPGGGTGPTGQPPGGHAGAGGPTGAENFSSEGGLKRFSCWCPKILAAIGRLPDTLADRCIIIRMQRKAPRRKVRAVARA